MLRLVFIRAFRARFHSLWVMVTTVSGHAAPAPHKHTQTQARTRTHANTSPRIRAPREPHKGPAGPQGRGQDRVARAGDRQAGLAATPGPRVQGQIPQAPPQLAARHAEREGRARPERDLVMRMQLWGFQFFGFWSLWSDTILTWAFSLGVFGKAGRGSGIERARVLNMSARAVSVNTRAPARRGRSPALAHTPTHAHTHAHTHTRDAPASPTGVCKVSVCASVCLCVRATGLSLSKNRTLHTHTHTRSGFPGLAGGSHHHRKRRS